MNQKEIEMLVQLRTYVIQSYNSLDGNQAGVDNSHSMMKQADVAHTLSTIARSLEDILGENVKYK